MTAHRSVLLVSSQWGRRAAIEKLLGLFDAQCCCAETAEQALVHMIATKVHVAVVDLDLDGFDGLTLIGHLWRHDPDLPVLVFGGNEQPAKRRAAAQAGVSAQFTWPPDPDALMLAIRVAANQPQGKSFGLTRKLMTTSSALALHAVNSQTTQEFLERALATLVQHFASDRGSLFTATPRDAGYVLRAQASHGIDTAHLREIQAGEGITGKVFASGLAQLFLDETRAQPGYEGCSSIGGLSSSMSVPMHLHDRVIGVVNLALCDPSRGFSPRDLETLAFLADHAALAMGQVEAQVEHACLRQQLQNAERLTVAGELTAGITHEIKSPLAFVQTNLRTLREYIAEARPMIEKALRDAQADGSRPDPACGPAVSATRELLDDGEPLLEECAGGLGKIARIVQDMRAMMHADAGFDAEPVRLAEVIAQAVKLTRARVAPVGRVEVACAGAPELRGSAVQLVQILVNLLNNAADAIAERPQGGTPGQIVVRAHSDSDSVNLEVEDNGAGMDAQTLARAFQPLFSTKLQRGGTGLGMGMVKRIVERHGGQVEVRSTPGVGTCVRMVFRGAADDAREPEAGEQRKV